MENFLKLKNGTIIFVTKYNEESKIYHGINLSSPELTQVNRALSKIHIGYYVDPYVALAIMKKKIDVENIYSDHPVTIFEKRLNRIIDELVKNGLPLIKKRLLESLE